jgi:hypothetical protein
LEVTGIYNISFPSSLVDQWCTFTLFEIGDLLCWSFGLLLSFYWLRRTFPSLKTWPLLEDKKVLSWRNSCCFGWCSSLLESSMALMAIVVVEKDWSSATGVGVFWQLRGTPLLGGGGGAAGNTDGEDWLHNAIVFYYYFY